MIGFVRIPLKLEYLQTFMKHPLKTLITPMSLLELLIAAKIGTDPQFLGSIWTQNWTGLDSNSVFGFQNWPKVDDVICTHSLKTNC